MNDLSTPQPAKQSFYNVSLAYHSDEHILKVISKNAGADIMLKMIVGVAVRRAEAEKVLVAFSAYTGRAWSFENLQVALMPTFADLHAMHQFDLSSLAKSTGVSYTIVDMMLAGHPVTRADAMLVLQMASRLASAHYTLETVDVPLIEGGNIYAAD